VKRGIGRNKGRVVKEENNQGGDFYYSVTRGREESKQ